VAMSLHLVICYANAMPKEHNPHRAVMGIDCIENLRLWHCHVLLNRGNEEYLAYGPIRGRGYRAVLFEDLKLFGLYSLFPELLGAYREGKEEDLVFGVEWRAKIFQDKPTAISDGQVKVAERVALSFGSLFPPVLIALLCFEPRLRSDPARGIESNGEVAGHVRRVVERAVPPDYLQNLKTIEKSWYTKGMVNTEWFPDVEQWITLFRTIILDRPPQPVPILTQPEVQFSGSFDWNLTNTNTITGTTNETSDDVLGQSAKGSTNGLDCWGVLEEAR
jgi:hypothetical protein